MEQMWARLFALEGETLRTCEGEPFLADIPKLRQLTIVPLAAGEVMRMCETHGVWIVRHFTGPAAIGMRLVNARSRRRATFCSPVMPIEPAMTVKS